MSEDGFCECGCGRPTGISDRTNATYGVVKGQPRRFINGHNRRKPRDTSEYPDLTLAPGERAVYGATVTLKRLDKPGSATIARTGMTATQALRSIIEDIDAWEGDWRIVCISTPPTIYRDLAGIRPVGERGGATIWPEVNYLSRLKRLDLLPPASPSAPIYEGQGRLALGSRYGSHSQVRHHRQTPSVANVEVSDE